MAVPSVFGAPTVAAPGHPRANGPLTPAVGPHGGGSRHHLPKRAGPRRCHTARPDPRRYDLQSMVVDGERRSRGLPTPQTSAAAARRRGCRASAPRRPARRERVDSIWRCVHGLRAAHTRGSAAPAAPPPRRPPGGGGVRWTASEPQSHNLSQHPNGISSTCFGSLTRALEGV